MEFYQAQAQTHAEIEEFNYVTREFAYADSLQKDQSVTPEELRAWLERVLKQKVELPFARMLVRVFDTSGDGALQLAEFHMLYRTMRYVDAAIGELGKRRQELKLANGGAKPGVGQQYMSKAELHEFLTKALSAQPLFPPDFIPFIVHAAQFQELGASYVRSAGGLFYAGGGGGGGGWGAAVPAGVGQLPGFRIAGATEGAGAFAAPAAPLVSSAVGEEVLPFLGILKVMAQIFAAIVLRSRMPKDEPTDSTLLCNKALWSVVFMF